MSKLSRSSELRKITVRAQFPKNGAVTLPLSKTVEAPFYKKLRKEHPQYREAVNNAIADLAVEAGLTRDQRPVMYSIH